MEEIRVPGGHLDVADGHAQMLGHDLGETGEVALPLGADAGGYADLAGGLDLHPGALIGTDAGAFDVYDHADADLPALSPQLRLDLRHEVVVVDHG